MYILIKRQDTKYSVTRNSSSTDNATNMKINSTTVTMATKNFNCLVFTESTNASTKEIKNKNKS
jgi:hypothetical protein